MKYSVPRGDGECLCYPRFEELPQLIESNHSLLESCDFDVGGKSFRALRAAARQKIAALAGRPFSAGLRIVLGAHQPGFDGPGILYKHRVLQALSREHLAFNFVVDSDVTAAVIAKTPYLRGESIGLKEIVIFPNPGHLVFENLCAPPKSEVDQRYAEIEMLLEYLGNDPVLSAFREFRAIHETVYKQDNSTARILTDYRRSYYPTPDVHEDHISSISQSEEFLAFACDIIRNIDKFHAEHNWSLDEHRKLHHIKSSANPFPDLARRGELWELPFWGLDADGRRHKLYASGGGSTRFVATEDGVRKSSHVEPETLLPLRIRPRAVCLTMFLRLFLGDLFVHGVGGGNYDQVTDKIIKRYYGVPAPGYVVCSRTRFLPNSEAATQKQRAAELRKKLRQMRHNPERLAPPGDSLAQEAVRILSESGGKFSVEQHARLKEIRRALMEKIKPHVCRLENELSEINQVMNRHVALRRRDLPYFFYQRSEL